MEQQKPEAGGLLTTARYIATEKTPFRLLYQPAGNGFPVKQPGAKAGMEKSFLP